MAPYAWKRGLKDLNAYLRQQVAPRRAGSGWIAVQLRGGALVSVRRDDAGLLVWCIAREQTPVGTKAIAKWHEEVKVFVGFLDLQLADRADERPGKVTFTERFIPEDRVQ